MMWRAIVVLAVHMACCLLIWSGYSWLVEGMGINPYISFPAAVILYTLTWYWLIKEANDADIEISCYLEYLDSCDKVFNEKLAQDDPRINRDGIRGRVIQIKKSLQYWEDIAADK